MKNVKAKMIKTKGMKISMLIALLATACTKSIPYKEVPLAEKEHYISKSLLATGPNDEYIYSASMQNASRSSADALPFSSGESKRVKIALTENSLKIIETERDSRYASNTANDKLVLEVPIEHAEFRCAKDSYSQCTNTEEAAKDIPWSQTSGVKVKLEEFKSAELDLLPILDSQTSGDNCYENVSTVLKSSDITADAINFQVERTFKTKAECLSNIDSIKDATITAVFHYSLVKTDTVLSKDFKVVSYPDGSQDEKSFGFFSTKRVQLDVDNNKTDKSLVQIMNHWNPNRSELTYYLSDEFDKPENKMIKDLTVKTVANINSGLEESGVKFRINLKDPAGKVPGDIRNSMIVLVEDPVESSIIGYGPQTEDPVTGEIISARTVMFLGTIKKYVKYTYDEIIREKKSLKLAANKSAGLMKLDSMVASKVKARKDSGVTAGTQSLDQAIANSQAPVKAGSKVVQGSLSPVIGAQVGAVASNKAMKLQEIKHKVFDYTAKQNDDFVGTDFKSSLKAKIKYLQQAKNCAFSPVMDNVAGGISPKLMDKFSEDAKPWTDLSDSEKEKVLEIILPEIWIPTLIHEMGHNLGLRHNFAASEDKDNYYSPEELKAKKVDHEIPFSSVMDYGNDLKTLPLLGKYDIAALRFGYLRTASYSVTSRVDGKVVSSGTMTLTDGDTTFEAKLKQIKASLPNSASLSASFRDYKYCTDENLGVGAGCRQFDLGSSYTEIAQNVIKDYEEGYAKRNFRNGRENMSLFDDITYASRINSTFRSLRLTLETVESLKTSYPDLADMNAPEWKEVPWLADLKQASLLSGAFLARVILTPDVTCAIAKTSDLTKIVSLAPLKTFSADAMSCFEVPLKSGYKMVGQTGKMFNSMKDPNSTNSYADQIDVRGIWIDKLMASKNLFNRQVGIFSHDNENDNYLSLPDLRDGLIDVMKAVMTNNVVDKVTFTQEDGQQFQLEISYDLYDSQIIDKSIHPMIAKQFGLLPDAKTQLQRILAPQFAQAVYDKSGQHSDDNKVALSFAVKTFAVDSVINPNAKSIVIDDIRYVADKDSNLLASESMDNLALALVLEKLEIQKVIDIAKAKLSKQPMPATATDDEKAVWVLDTNVIVDYVNGVIKSSDYYKSLITFLPTVSALQQQ